MSMGVTGGAMVAGVVGHPVAHSMSPWLHGRWIAAAGLDAAYVPFACGADGFARLVEGLRGGAIRGLNVTAPFKREALAIADFANDAAQAAASANLLLFATDGGVEARSTDGYGVVTALARQIPGLRPGQAVVLGAGGAGAAAAAALALAGWRVALVNRTLVTAEAVAAELPEVEAVAPDRLGAVLAEATLLVNALPFAPEAVALRGGLTVLDMGYRPHWTPLLIAARAAGCGVVHGIDMLIAQAEPSFGAFYGLKAPRVAGLREAAVAMIGAV